MCSNPVLPSTSASITSSVAPGSHAPASSRGRLLRVAAVQGLLPVASQSLPGASNRVQLSRLLLATPAAQHIEQLCAREAQRLCAAHPLGFRVLEQTRIH